MAGVLVYAAWSHESDRGHALFTHWPAPDWTRIRALLKLGLPAASGPSSKSQPSARSPSWPHTLHPSRLPTHENRPQLRRLHLYGVRWESPPQPPSPSATPSEPANPARARRAGILAHRYRRRIHGPHGVLLIVIPQPIISIWTRDARVLTLGAHILAIVAGFQIFDGIQTVSTGALRASAKPASPCS